MQTDKKEIKSGKKTIGEVFEEWYNVPSYQRHYVWEKDNITDLLDDVLYAAENTPNDEYFLGSYVIQSTKSGNDLLDGQQRLTTLFVLFAVLRDIDSENKEIKDVCQQFVYQKANKLKKVPERVRLLYQIRDNASNFINDSLIKENSIIEEYDKIEEYATSKTANPTIKHLCNAVIVIKEYFKENPSIDIEVFLQYLINNVVLIYVSADSLHDAFRFFSILNDRGIKLNNSDIIKSQNLQVCSEIEVTRYAKSWESMQEVLGDDFDRFLSYVRTILVKEKAKSSLLDEFEKFVFETGKIKQGPAFFQYIEKAYTAYTDLFEDTSKLISENIELKNLILVLQYSMQATDWVAVLISYYMKFGDKNIYKFTKKLACKVIADWVNGESPTRRIEGVNKIIQTIETHSDVNSLENSEAFNFDINLFLQSLQSDIYGRAFAKPLLLLLDFIYNDNNTNKWSGFTQISVEHILPQNPEEKSKWCIDFSEEERLQWTHKLGNLCLIGRKKNTSLGILDYEDKKERYFKDKIANFPNTLHIYNKYKTWKLDDVIDNQKTSIEVIKKFFAMLK
jgi:hypothetical protein